MGCCMFLGNQPLILQKTPMLQGIWKKRHNEPESHNEQNFKCHMHSFVADYAAKIRRYLEEENEESLNLITCGYHVGVHVIHLFTRVCHCKVNKNNTKVTFWVDFLRMSALGTFTGMKDHVLKFQILPEQSCFIFTNISRRIQTDSPSRYTIVFSGWLFWTVY